ncbi:hypothetical protein F5Y18DRAFT_198935 [Xylariaceae sp. FL1019]|nr:hypothetical protein F5Y18DRAFT_198935 [Xylariaceae sp. FL1019]
MALNTHAHNRPLDESIYPRSLDSEEGDPVLEEKNFGETSQQLVEELGRPRKSQLSTPSLFDNQFTAYEPLGSNNRNNSDPNHTASYPAAAIANTNRVPTERELVEDPLTSSEINRTEANTPGVQILLQPPEDGSSHGSRRKTESVHSGHSGHSDFTHVTPVEDFGLTVGMEHIREQIRNGQLCPKFSTRMRDDASTRSHQSDRDAALSESTDFKGIGDHLDDRPQIALPQEHPVKNKRIADQLENMVESKPQNEEFLPWDELLAVLHEANVERELAIHFPPGQVRELVSAICQEDPKRSRRIIMAILSSIADVPSIQHFIANDIFDADLPFLKNTSDVSNDAEHREEQPGRRYRTSKELPPTWPPRVGRSFRTEQYRFLVPFFDMPGNHVNFYRINEKGIILPFLLWDQEKEGGYGTVWKAQIHPAHHNWRPSTSTNTSQKIAKDENPIVAVKEIRSNDYEAYKQEVRVLERFSGSQKGHEHLIRLLMAFQHDSKYYLVFPLAEGGNLQHIWERTTKDPYNRCDVIWLLSQSRGITEGLWKIHQHKSWFANGGLAPSLDSDKNRGRHGDIKPQNILAFKTDVEGEYRLVISDFGLTRFHSALSVSNVPLNKIGGLSFTYRAPEFDQSPSTSQAYDMWGLGCLLLELISWFLLGNANGPKAFRILRNRDDEPSPGVLPHISNTVEDKFFNIIDEKAVVKRSVTQWIDKLRGLENCPTSISDLLKEIKTDLLVTTKDTRAKVDVFHANLTEILKTSKERLDYCVPTVRNAGVKKPVEATISAQCDSEESQDETPASRRQSSIIQHIIIRQRDNYRVSLDNSRQTTASLQQALGNVLGSDRVTSPLPQETRLPSPKRSDTTVKANNYKISGHSESNGAYEQQIPRTARVPNLTRNTSTLTETTANPSQDSGR